MSNVPTTLNLPHGSHWPILFALGFALFAFGFVMGGPLLLIGLAALAFGGLGWLHEDTVFYRNNVSTGARNGWWACILFLCTEVMIFGGLFATYFHGKGAFDGLMAERAAAGLQVFHWGPPDGVHLPVLKTGINTIILLASGVTMHWAHAALRKGNKRTFNIGLVLTIILGAIFLYGQVLEYGELIGEGMTLSRTDFHTDDAGNVVHSLFGSVFYMLTGTHGVHVAAGLLFIIVCLARSLMGQFTAERHVAVETAAIYWHFVDAVWVVLYAVVYLLK